MRASAMYWDDKSMLDRSLPWPPESPGSSGHAASAEHGTERSPQARREIPPTRPDPPLGPEGGAGQLPGLDRIAGPPPS